MVYPISTRWGSLCPPHYYLPLPHGFLDLPTTLLTFLCISLSPSEARKYSKKSTRKLVNRAIFSLSILVIWKLKWNLNYFKQTKAKMFKWALFVKIFKIELLLTTRFHEKPISNSDFFLTNQIVFMKNQKPIEII